MFCLFAIVDSEVRCEAINTVCRTGVIDCRTLETTLSRLRDVSVSVRTSAFTALIQLPFPQGLQLNNDVLSTMEDLLKFGDNDVIQQCLETFISKWKTSMNFNLIEALKAVNIKAHPIVASLLVSVADESECNENTTLEDLMTEPLDKEERCFLLLEKLKRSQSKDCIQNEEMFEQKIGNLKALGRALAVSDWWIQCQCLIVISRIKPLSEKRTAAVKCFCIQGLSQLTCPVWDCLKDTLQKVLEQYPSISQEALRERLITASMLECIDFSSAMLLVNHSTVSSEQRGLAQYAWSLNEQNESILRYEFLYSLSASNCGNIQLLMDSLKTPSLEHRQKVCEGLFDLICVGSLSESEQTTVVHQLVQMLIDYNDIIHPVGDTIRIGMMKLMVKEKTLNSKMKILVSHQLLRFLLKQKKSKTWKLTQTFLRAFCQDEEDGSTLIILAMTKFFKEMMKKALIVDSITKNAVELVSMVMTITSSQKSPRPVNLNGPKWWVLEWNQLTLLAMLSLECIGDCTKLNEKVLAKVLDAALCCVDFSKLGNLQSLPIIQFLLRNCKDIVGSFSCNLEKSLEQLNRLDLPQLDKEAESMVWTSVEKIGTQNGRKRTLTPVKRPESPNVSPQTESSSPVILIEDGFNNALELSRICRSLGARVLSSQENFVPEVTHVLSPISSPSNVEDCFAAVIALLTGRWVVSAEWLASCLRMNSFVSPTTALGCAKFANNLPILGLKVYVADSFAAEFDQELHIILHLLERAGGVKFVERPSEADVVLSAEAPSSLATTTTTEEEKTNANTIGSHGQVLSWSMFASRLFLMAKKQTESMLEIMRLSPKRIRMAYE